MIYLFWWLLFAEAKLSCMHRANNSWPKGATAPSTLCDRILMFSVGVKNLQTSHQQQNQNYVQCCCWLTFLNPSLPQWLLTLVLTSPVLWNAENPIFIKISFFSWICRSYPLKGFNFCDSTGWLSVLPDFEGTLKMWLTITQMHRSVIWSSKNANGPKRLLLDLLPQHFWHVQWRP